MNPYDVCRACFHHSSPSDFVSLYGDGGRLKSYFELCTGVSLYEDHNKSALICRRCVIRLKSAYRLRKSARTIEMTLQNENYNPNIKPAYDIRDVIDFAQSPKFKISVPGFGKDQLKKIMRAPLPGIPWITEKKKAPEANKFKRFKWNFGLTEKFARIRQYLSPQTRNQFSFLHTVPFLRRNLRRFGVEVTYKEEEQIIQQSQLLVVPPKRMYRKKLKTAVVVKNKKSTKKNKSLGIKTQAVIAKRNKPKIYIPSLPPPSPMPSPTADNDIKILLENFKGDADTQMLMDSIEQPSLLFSSVDSTVPIDMELDFDLSGPSSSTQRTIKTYSKAYKNKSFFCSICQCYGSGSAVIHRAKYH